MAAAALFVFLWVAIAAAAGPDGKPSSAGGGTAGQVIVIDRRMLEQLGTGGTVVRIGEPVATAPLPTASKARKSRAS